MPCVGVRGLDAQLPSSAVLQSNPVTKDLVLHMLYSGRDAAASDAGAESTLAATLRSVPVVCGSSPLYSGFPMAAI